MAKDKLTDKELQLLEEEAMDELFRQGIARKIPGWLDTLDELPEPPESPTPTQNPDTKTRPAAAAQQSPPPPSVEGVPLPGRIFSPWALALAVLLPLAGALWLWTKLEKSNTELAALNKKMEQLSLENETVKNERNVLLNDLKNSQSASPEIQKTEPRIGTPEPQNGNVPPGKISGDGNSGKAKTDVAAKDTKPNLWESMAYEKLDESAVAFADTPDRSETPDLNSPTAKAKDFLKNKNYAQAAKTLSEIKKPTASSLELLAYAQGKSGQRAAAAETFKKYMTLAKPSDKADWQLCLYLLGDFRNRNEEFFNELGKILDDPEHKFHAEAKSLNYRVNPVAEASENLSDLFASVENNQWDGKTKGGRGGNTASEEHFEAARTEFSKPNHNNNFIKNHLLQISPSDKETFPYAQIMLAQVYFQEKDYRMAVWAYKKYASFDGSSDVQWRLLNFRLAAYPFQKDEFWDLLKKLEDDGGDFGEKAKKMRNGLKERGISN